MKTLRNERGYTLLIVLLTITLMFPIAILLINANVNSSRQLQLTEAHNSSIALAEMGIIRARAEVEHALNTLDDNEINSILASTRQPEEVNREIGELIISRITGGIKELDETFSYDLQVKLGNTETDSIIFDVTSMGKSGTDYEITAEIVVLTEVTVDSTDQVPEEGSPEDGSGGGNGSGGSTGDFDDPRNFEDWGSLGRRIRESVNAPTITPARDGGTFDADNPFPTDSTSLGFHHAVTINPGAHVNLTGGMSVSGNLEISNITEISIGDTLRVAAQISLNNVRNFFVRGDTFASGGIELTNSGARIGGNVDFQTAIELDSSNLIIEGGTAVPAITKIENNSAFTMYGDMAKESPLEINNSTATFNGYTALNGLEIRNATSIVRTKNLFVGGLDVSDSRLLVNGSFRTNWDSFLNNSTVTVQGHLLAGSTITLENNSLLYVYGNIDFSAGQWQSIAFRGSGSQVIVYGESEGTTLNPYLNIRIHVPTREDCVESNVVCFIAGDPPSNGSGQEGDSGNSDQDGEGDTDGIGEGINFIWDEDLKLQNVVYVGARRSR